MISCLAHPVGTTRRSWSGESVAGKRIAYLFSMDFCTSKRTTHKMGEDEEDEKRAGASVWKKERLCLMNSRLMSYGTRGCLALDDRHLEGGGKVVGHSQCRGSVT